MIKVVKKNNRLLLTIISTLIISIIVFFKYLKKENVYILYNTSIADCKYKIGYQITDFPICDKKGNLYFFKKISEQPIVFKERFNNLNLKSKDEFFEYANPTKINIFLVVKRGEKYEVIPVKLLQVLGL